MISRGWGLDRVERGLADGTLVRPGTRGRADLVDLVQALAACCGARAPTPLSLRIAPAGRLVFVLVDGLGLELVQRLIPHGFLHRHLLGELETVFPSTTAVALTSLTTGMHACVHGIPGWFAWMPELGVSAEVLPFVERFTKRPLAEWGVRAERFFAVPSIFPSFGPHQLVVTRTYICDSIYSRYWCAGCPSVGYDRIEDGVARVLAALASASPPTYTHLYINHLDSLCHERGIGHPDVLQLARRIDAALEQLCRGLGDGVRVVITADHGHIDAGVDWQMGPEHPLMPLLACPPSGEARVPIFHLAAQVEPEEFRTGFESAFGEDFSLLTMRQVESLGLLGPEPLSDGARAHFGDFLALAEGSATLRYCRPGHDGHRHTGVHAGLTPAEMLVPLIVI